MVCEKCQKYRTSQTTQPMMVTEEMLTLWSKVGMDQFTYDGKKYILVLDYYSHFPEITRFENSTENMLLRLSNLSLPGIAYQKWSCQTMGHNLMVMSSSVFQETVEESNTDTYLASLAGPLKHGFSPAKLLFNREFKTRLPNFVVADDKHNSDMNNYRINDKCKQRHYYYKRSQELMFLLPHERVCLYDGKTWIQKAVASREVTPRSYKGVTNES